MNCDVPPNKNRQCAPTGLDAKTAAASVMRREVLRVNWDALGAIADLAALMLKGSLDAEPLSELERYRYSLILTSMFGRKSQMTPNMQLKPLILFARTYLNVTLFAYAKTCHCTVGRLTKCYAPRVIL